MNDNRIFSYEDVLAMDNEEGKYYQKALDYQYGKIGFPMNAERANSSDVVFVQEYTRQDGTVVRAHYRSKAGHAAPDKPVMKSPQEYKSELEKEINDYMDRDVQERYGAGVNRADEDIDYLQELIDILPETELEYVAPDTGDIEPDQAPLYPSNGMLTGQIEMSHDVSNEIPAVNIQPNIKPSPQPKPISKPYTGREMEIKNIELPERRYLGVLDDLAGEYSRDHKYRNIKAVLPNKQITAEDVKSIIMDKLFLYKNDLGFKDKVKNIVTLYPEILLSPIQAAIAKNKTLSSFKLINRNRPLSANYYRLSLEPEEYIKKDLDNEYTYMMSVSNPILKRHLFKMNNTINENTLVVMPRPQSPLIKEVKNSNRLKEFIIQNQNAIKSGNFKGKIVNDISFYNDRDLDTLLGETHVYNAYIDNSGNLHLQIPDYYDFERRKWSKDAVLFSIMNNSANIQQLIGRLTNYVLLLNITYTKEELSNLPGWK